MSFGKILSSTLFREQVQRTFILHRDLRSCLTLSEAEKLVAQRQHEIKDYGKTAFLQFLNNFPLNYSYKFLASPLKIYLLSVELQNLSTYEQQLRYTVLSKLKEYVCMDEKGSVQEMINNSEKSLMEIKQTRPFDTAHAINFLLLQKDSKSTELFEHCLDVIKKTDYLLFKTLMHRIVPIFLKRLGPDDWNIIRRFDYLIEALTFDFLPKDIMTIHYAFFVEKIAEMQLQSICYHKIPPALDFIIGYYVKQIESNRDIEVTKLQTLFKAFNHLPMGYNEKAFNIFFKKLLQKAETQSVHLDNLPYRRLTTSQINTFYSKFGPKNFKLHQLIYSGNVYQARKAYLTTDLSKQLYEQFMSYIPPNGKNLINSLMAASILVEYFKNDEKIKETIKQKTKALINSYRQELPKYIKFFSISSIFNLITLQKEVQIGGLYGFIKQMVSDIVFRANNDDFKELKFLDNIVESVLLYADSPIPEIRNTIASTIIGVTHKTDRFYFKKYSQLIFALCKSEYYAQYKTAINEMLKHINKDDCGFLVELYNRYPSKSMKLYTNFFGLIKNIDSSFQCMGRFMITSSYTHFTTSRGELQLEFRRTLEAIEPTLSVNTLKGFYMPEITIILKFCTRFYYFLSEFSRKMLMVSLSYIQSLDCMREDGKFLLNFIQEAISLKLISNSSEEIIQKILSQIKKLRQSFPSNLTYKAKEIQFRWLLGADESEDKRSLIVEQILSQLSSENYSEKHSDVMIILLKLNSLEVIKLKKVVQEKFLSLILNSLEGNEIKANDIISHLYLPFKKGGSSLGQINAGGISKILLLLLDKIGTKQNFEYYMRIVEFANYVKDSQLLAKAFDCMSETHISPSQIKKIINVLRFYRNIQINKFSYKLLKDTDTLFDYLKTECGEILYCVHLSKNEISTQEHELTKKLLNKHEQFLKDSLNKREFNQNTLLVSIIKHLWVSIKINELSIGMKPLFKYAIEHHGQTKNEKNKGNFFGIPSENVAFIYEAIIKFGLANDAKFIESFRQGQGQGQRKSLFKPASNTLPNILQTVQQDNKKLFTFLISYFNAQDQNLVSQSLIKQGFQLKTKANASNNNIFELNKNINGVNLNAWIKKDNIEYGIIYINDRYLTVNNNLKGRVNFTINSLNIITGIKNIPLRPGQELKIE